MITGLPPFYDQDRDRMFERIKFGKIDIPAFITPSFKNFIEQLFIKNPEKRIGSKKGA